MQKGNIEEQEDMGSEKQAKQFKLCMWRQNKPPKCHEMGTRGQPPWEWFETPYVGV